MNQKILFEFMPEIKEIFIRRYKLLNLLDREGTMGRRTISSKLNISERIIRDEIEILKRIGAVNVSTNGVSPTNRTVEFLHELSKEYQILNKRDSMLKALKEVLNVEKLYVVKSEANKELTYKNLGILVSDILIENLKDGDTLGVTGGKTISSIADEIREHPFNNLVVVPARGSLGRAQSYQSNSICSRLAIKLSAHAQILPLPETASPEALEMLLETEEVKEAYEKLKNIDLLLFGIGRADVMTKKRRLDEKRAEEILSKGAVAEAFGHYFDLEGRGIYKSLSIGISFDEFLKIKNVLGAAIGEDKAKAIKSISTLRSDMTLIIDEDAANGILKLGGKK